MKPEARLRVHWTKVSTNTKVQIGAMAKEAFGTLSHMPAKVGITNTIVQLHSQAAA